MYLENALQQTHCFHLFRCMKAWALLSDVNILTIFKMSVKTVKNMQYFINFCFVWSNFEKNNDYDFLKILFLETSIFWLENRHKKNICTWVRFLTVDFRSITPISRILWFSWQILHLHVNNRVHPKEMTEVYPETSNQPCWWAKHKCFGRYS